MENIEVSIETQSETKLEASPNSADSAPEVQKITDLKQIEQVLEAVIFAAPRAISLIRLRNILNSFHYDTSGLTDILESMIASSKERGYQLIKVAGGFQYRTAPEHAEVLQKLLEDKPARLSGSALEVLAIIAYKQPLTRSEIDSVRGVDSGHLLKGLLEKNLVRTLGHAETPGRPLMYGTAPYFLEVFGMGSLDDLPAIDELKRELVQGAGPSSDNDESIAMAAAELGLGPDGSMLAANPDRGAFDQPVGEEPVDMPDFGEQERAAEEVSQN